MALPDKSRFLYIDVDRSDIPHMWIMVDIDQPEVAVEFKQYVTGETIDSNHHYLGSYHQNNNTFIGHVFQKEKSI